MKDQEYDYFYKDDGDKKYCYPGTNVLKNELDIRELELLHEAERDYSSLRQAELVKKGVMGDFSMKHLCSIHKQLFQDIYTWAGKTRTVDIAEFCEMMAMISAARERPASRRLTFFKLIVRRSFLFLCLKQLCHIYIDFLYRGQVE